MLSAYFAPWKAFLKKALLGSFTMLVMISIVPSLVAAQELSQTLAMHYTVNDATAGAISRNWSGYIASAGTFTSVAGTWDVPHVTGSGHAAADATWVGIGGFRSNDLIQSGTENIVSGSGQVTPLAFFEMLPSAAQTIPITVRSGDAIRVSLTEHATNQWRLAFQDITNGQVYSTTVAYPSSFSSAEWIEEAPSRGNKILSLDNFGTVQFSQGSTIETGNQVTVAQSHALPIILANKSHQILATPSLPGGDGASFTITRK